MHAIVVGCGRVGSSVAAALEADGHSVAVIDKNQQAFHRLPPTFRGLRVNGLGFDRDRLEEAGIARASALAAVTNGDNSNIVVARVAREKYRLERVVARIYDPRRAVIYERLGIPTVATVHWSADRVMKRLVPDTPTVEWTDPSARICLVEREVPPGWAGREAEALGSPTIRVVAISRQGEARLPSEGLLLQDGDVAWLAVEQGAVGELGEHLDPNRTKQ